MAVPVVFLMLSNHYPVATYGNRYGWEILAGPRCRGMDCSEADPRISDGTQFLM